MRRIGLILAKLDAAASFIGIACVALMMIHVTLDVAGRYLLNMPVEGTITIVSHYYMVILGFIALGVAERRDAHISVEIVADLMPRGAQRGLGVFASLIGAAAFSVLAVRTWIEADSKAAIGASLQQGSLAIPIWPSYYALPIGCGLMVLVAVYKLVAQLTGKGGEFVTAPTLDAERSA